MDWEHIYHDLKIRNWLILFILSFASFFFMNNQVTLGVLLGGLMTIANLGICQHTIRRAFRSEGILRGTKAGIVARFYLRLFALAAVIYLLIKRGWVHPFGLAAGLSIVVVSIVSLGIHRALKASDL